MNSKLLFLLVLPVLALAEERPVIPTPGEDLVLTEGKSAKDFFEARKQNTECRKNWETTFAENRAAQAELIKMVAQGTPAKIADVQEAKVREIRARLLVITDECGPCKNQPLENLTISSDPAEYWKITDGSCYFPPESAEKAIESFNKVTKSMLNTSNYARQRGGFDSILEFVPIDRITGKVLPHIEKVDISKPLATYISVRAKPKGAITFNYTFDNTIEIREANGKKEFILTFHGFEQPESLDDLPVFDTTLSGTKKEIKKFKTLTKVIGMWYFNTDGYYRYFTAADFESILFSTGFGNKDAEKVLLDTVLTLAERGL